MLKRGVTETSLGVSGLPRYRPTGTLDKSRAKRKKGIISRVPVRVLRIVGTHDVVD